MLAGCLVSAALATRHVLTGLDDREANMVAFAAAVLELFVATLASASLPGGVGA